MCKINVEIMNDFTSEIINDLFIITVNLTRATFKDVSKLQKLLSDAIRNGFKKILIEMNEVDYVDSTFLGLLVVYLKETIKTKGKICLVGLKPSVYTLVQHTHLDKTFNIYISRDDALKNM